MSPDDDGYGDSGRHGGPGRGDGPPDGYGTSGYGGSGQTRTRLPERAGDHHGGARRSRTSSRGLVTVVGIVVLLIAAIAFANRADEEPEAGAGADRPRADTTAATGTRPVDSENNGIASGYAHDTQGAQSAAANYAVALGSAEMFDKGRRDAIVNATYVSESAAARQADLDKAYSTEAFLRRIGLNPDGTAPDGQTFISRVIPVGTKVEKSNADNATIAVWHSSLFGLAGEASKNPVTESWYTTTYELRWTDGDWKVVDFDQRDGPVPTGRDQRASTADDLATAVDQYGGFTYAR
ncbi:hypothetical protein ACIQXD_23495 [Streptomyces uncialis]|uniref:hypothetical protein n=1 Tax=Streptomyces uncialis TaxID=1048205 RepID=UPI00382793D8